MKLIKRLLLLFALILVIVAAVEYWRIRRIPEHFEHVYTWSDTAERAEANQRVVENYVRMRNLAAEAQAAERRAETSRSAAPDGHHSVTVQFTEEELNAALRHHPGYYSKVEEYARQPGIYLRQGRIILAGEVKDTSLVASVYLEPRIDPDGQLRLRLAETTLGNRSIPLWMLSSKVNELRQALESRLPNWQREARMSEHGAPNGSTVAAALGQLLLGMLNDQPVQNVLFLKDEGSRALLLRLTDIRIEPGRLTLSVETMTPTQRTEAFARIRGSAALDSSDAGH